MLKLRPQPLGIPIVSDVVDFAEGLVGGGCSGVRNIPGISDIVFKNGGCTPEGRKLAAAAMQVWATSSGGPYGAILAPVGYAAAVNCVCGSSTGGYNGGKLPPPPPPPPWYKSPMVMVGGAALAVGLIAVAMHKKNSGGSKASDKKKLNIFGHDVELEGGKYKFKHERVDTSRKSDYGADPLGDGTFRMVPSGDVVDFDERNRRLKR